MHPIFLFITIKLTKNTGKEVIILKSSLSRELFQNFVSTYQICNQDQTTEVLTMQQQLTKPFVYVNNDGSMRLITNVVDSIGGDDEIFALSIAQDGYMEFLAFQE